MSAVPTILSLCFLTLCQSARPGCIDLWAVWAAPLTCLSSANEKGEKGRGEDGRHD